MYGNPGNPGGMAMTVALANANRVTGPFIRLEPEAFETILSRSESPLVVCAPAGMFGRGYQYVTSYKGLTFYTKSKESLRVPPDAEIVQAQSMTVPM